MQIFCVLIQTNMLRDITQKALEDFYRKIFERDSSVQPLSASSLSRTAYSQSMYFQNSIVEKTEKAVSYRRSFASLFSFTCMHACIREENTWTTQTLSNSQFSWL